MGSYSALSIFHRLSAWADQNICKEFSTFANIFCKIYFIFVFLQSYRYQLLSTI